MNWKELVKEELESAYAVTDRLMGLVEDGQLDWKPATGNNWMTTGQLLRHLAEGNGFCVRAFITGDWQVPGGPDLSEMPADAMLPPAEAMQTVGSVEEARKMLAEDKKTALEALAQVDENELATKVITAPWDPTQRVLGRYLLMGAEHMNQHKGQLFYYLKLQGQPMHTGHLWSVGA